MLIQRGEGVSKHQDEITTILNSTAVAQ